MLPAAFAVPFLLLTMVGLLVQNSTNLYSSGLNLQAMDLAETDRLRAFGCAPLVDARRVAGYAASGVALCHESYSPTEELEKLRNGTNIVERPELVELIAERGIGLTSCPISNTWVSDGSKVEPIKDLVARGVKVCLNSDDPAYFGGYIAENYQRAADEGEVDQAFLVQLARNAVDICWAPAITKATLRAEIDTYAAGA